MSSTGPRARALGATTVPFPVYSSRKSPHVHACMWVRECIWIDASPLFLMEFFFLRVYCVSCFLRSKMYLGDFFISVHQALTHLLFSQLFMASHFVARSQFIYLLGLFPVYCRFKQCCSILPQTYMLCIHGKRCCRIDSENFRVKATWRALHYGY